MHGVRFGTHGEQSYITGGTESTYDTLTFNANLVAWSATGIAAFLCSSYSLAGEKTFFIDPLTHSFQHDPSALKNDEGQVKPSVRKLVAAYGAPVEGRVGDSAVLPQDFDDEDLTRSFVERVIRFQHSQLDREARETDAWEMLEFKYEEEHGEILDLTPSFVIAPYHFMRKSTVDKWINLNLKMANMAKESADFAIGVELVISPDVLTHKETRDKIIDEYSELDIRRIVIWLDGFSEHDVSSQELVALKTLTKGLSKNGKSVINLYGGYFSMLLGRPDGPLAGVCHGPGYGESREVTPVGGGLPRARFYWFDLHKRLRFADALRLFETKGWLNSEEQFFTHVCSCPQCESFINQHGVQEGFKKYGETKPVTFTRSGSTVSMDFPVSEAQKASARHYLFNKEREWAEVRTNALADLHRQLRTTMDTAARSLGLDSVAYLGNWIEATEG